MIAFENHFEDAEEQQAERFREPKLFSRMTWLRVLFVCVCYWLCSSYPMLAMAYVPLIYLTARADAFGDYRSAFDNERT